MSDKTYNKLRDFLETAGHTFSQTQNEAINEYFVIAGHVFRMEFEDSRMKEYFTWQMKLFVTEEREAFGTIRVKTDKMAGEITKLMEEAEHITSSVQTSNGPVAFYVRGKGVRIGELVFAWWKELKAGLVLIEPEQLENFYQISYMLTPLFSRLAPDIGMTLIHGAGVGVNGQGVILSGLSGSGKSSLAAACLMSGMQYVSDDTMFLDKKSNKAHPICSTIHLVPKILDIFREISGEEFFTRNGRGEKRHMDISFMRDQFVPGLCMRALIVLRIEEGSREFGIRPVRWEQAAVPLIYSSAHLLGEAQNAPAVRNVLSCLRKLPAYEFHMSGNLRYNAEYLKSFIENNFTGE